MSDAPDPDDLTAAFPAFNQVTAMVGEREIVVREMTTVQSLGLSARMAPVIAALQPLYGDGREGISGDTVMAALEAHPDAALEMLALSTGQPVEWLAALPESIGSYLLMLCVGVHVPFFVSRLERAYQSQAQRDLLNAAQALAKSSPGSSATGTAKPH